MLRLLTCFDPFSSPFIGIAPLHVASVQCDSFSRCHASLQCCKPCTILSRARIAERVLLCKSPCACSFLDVCSNMKTTGEFCCGQNYGPAGTWFLALALLLPQDAWAFSVGTPTLRAGSARAFSTAHVSTLFVARHAVCVHDMRTRLHIQETPKARFVEHRCVWVRMHTRDRSWTHILTQSMKHAGFDPISSQAPHRLTMCRPCKWKLKMA